MKKIITLILTLALLCAVAAGCDSNTEKSTGKFDVNFDKQDGSPVITQSQQIEHSSGFVDKPEDPSRTGYLFAGWYKEPSFENKWDFDKDTLKSGDNITLYARWVHAYTIYLYAQGGKFNEYQEDEQSVAYGEDYVFPVPVLEAYVFAGWYSDVNGTGTQYTDENGASLQKWLRFSGAVMYAYWVRDDAPMLTVPTVQTSANINTLYTLPIAQAEDAFGNPATVIATVLDPDMQPVREYAVNKYGYAYGDAGKAVSFDNNLVRSFYPAMVGTYKITFKAVDGRGKESPEKVFYIECKDQLAPVIYSIKSEQIPSECFINDSFRLPMPECADNLTARENLTIVVRISNPEGIIVANWDGTIGKVESDGLDADPRYQKYFKNNRISECVLTANGIWFSFDVFDFGNDILGNSDSAKYGEWSLTYIVRDERGYGGSGTARKSYTINVKAP